MLTRATWAALCVAAAVAKFVPLGRQRPTAAIPGQEDEELPQTFIDTSQLHIGLLFATLNSGHQSMRPVQVRAAGEEPGHPRRRAITAPGSSVITPPANR